MNDLQTTIMNLEKIHRELPLLADKIPSIRKDFIMGEYGCYNNSTLSNPVCDSHGCGLGNSARLFDVSKPEYYNKWGKFCYTSFSKDILPSLKSDLWHYLFSVGWGEEHSGFKTFDNFIDRVSNMIELLKEKGVVEVSFYHSSSNDLTIINH